MRLISILIFLIVSRLSAAAPLILSCSSTNDLYRALSTHHPDLARHDTPDDAINSAPAGAAVLILADHYPIRRIEVSNDLFAQAAEKKLRLYVEYPSHIPGHKFELPKQAHWERLVVSSDNLGASLPRLRIFSAHACTYIPTTVPNPRIVLARVAGFDTAVYGLPKQSHPILFSTENDRWLIATTKLSNFITGRYAPTKQWTAVWLHILKHLDPTTEYKLAWEPTARPALGPADPLPPKFESSTFRTAADWYLNSKVLIHSNTKAEIHRRLASGAEAAINLNTQNGDGSLGILEGYASQILHDGIQPQRLPIRLDCAAESAMVLALDHLLSRNEKSEAVATNLLNYTFFTAPSWKGPRGNPQHPAFGLISWGEVAPAWLVANYGDDNARAMLATMASAAALKTDRFDKPLLRALYANLRTTGQLGFRGDRIDNPQLEQHGWKHFNDAKTINYSPHFESYLWACYLWAHARTGDAELLTKAQSGIRMTMDAYPKRWRWGDNLERSKMLLCLAWLIRVNDTPQHRQWLHTLANDMLQSQQPSGALREKFAGTGGGHYQVPQSNEAYGTGETPLLQKPDDPVTDQLYTTPFAILALREAVALTNDPKLKAAEDKLAEYLCRIQIKSDRPELRGAWFRAFNDQDWDYWASSADIGWGAWCIEAGWGQSWIAATLALREKQTSFWELTAGSRIQNELDAVRAEMRENNGAPWRE